MVHPDRPTPARRGRRVPRSDKPYDQRLAAALVRPLARTPVSPNALTALGLALGLLAAWLFATGHPAWGGTVFVLAALADHCDGELARLANRASRFGHWFDRVAAFVNYTAVVLGMGIGSPFAWGWAAGLAAGLSIAGILAVRNLGAWRQGEAFMDQSGAAGFETEDVMYLIAPIGWLGWHPWFVAVAAVGAPVYLAFTLLRLRPRRG